MSRIGISVAIVIGLITLAAHGMAQSSDPYQTVVPPAPPVAATPDAPLPPPNIAAPTTPPPGLVPVQPTIAAPSGTLSLPSTGGDQAGLPPVANIWRPRNIAVLAALNQQDGAVSRLNVKVGSTFTRDSLHVSVQACVVRPAGAIPDAAVFLTVMAPDGANQTKTLFNGWLVRSEPGAAVVANGTVSFQVLGCKAR
jgi:hypothetical protein